MHERQIFEDPSGRRGSTFRVLLTLCGLAVSAILTVFIISLGVSSVPVAAKAIGHLADTELSQNRKVADAELKRVKTALKAASQVTSTRKRPANKIVLGYYAPWESAGIDSLRANASRMTHVAPAWFRLTELGTALETKDFDPQLNPATTTVIELANRNGLHLVPLVSNASASTFSSARLGQLLKSRDAQQAILDRLVSLAKQYNFDGYQFDFEEIEDKQLAGFGEFLKLARTRFGAANLEFSVAVQTTVSAETLKAWTASVDYFVLMGYDEHHEEGESGPIAGATWFEDHLDDIVAAVGSNKVVAGIGSYAYDWKKGKSGAESMSFQEAMAAAAGYRDADLTQSVISLDPDSLNCKFDYIDDQGTGHVVWILDALSAFNHWFTASELSVRGCALWALGTEDPQVWTFLGQELDPEHFDLAKIEKISFPFEVSYVGKGEVLKVESRPSPGARKVSLDPETGMVDSVRYQSYPTTYVIRKSGYRPKKLVLTFDDGPDVEWTPKILSILKEKAAPGVFFVVGANVEANPNLAKQIVEEGHEIGSHSFSHPNLGQVSAKRLDLELSVTARVIEAITGVSTRLFRPPFNADSQPETADEVRPVDRADQLGYLTVGENIDPNDWAPTIEESDGSSRPRTAADITRLVLDDLRSRKVTGEEGNIILLHDAGGNRSQTVEALPALIDRLRAEGYEIVSLSSLLGIPRSTLMPAVRWQDRGLVGIDLIAFRGWHVLQVILFFGFIGALLLGTLRVFLVTPLALIQFYRRKAHPIPTSAVRSPVTVLIAAYNEDKTIASTVRSVLASSIPIAEILVIDDGSKDGTSAVVAETFADNPIVRVITKPNGGKASALNVGIAEAKGELLFCIDADTRLEPDAIERLENHFANPNVAAVAGNVHVGNVLNMITAWQGVEYRTSQNLDRLAFESLNAITVIPGAIGMWRKSAVVEAGSYSSDTLAEDMDLTWRLRKRGYRLETESAAVAWTEAPEDWVALFKQRFRWAYGTAQCLWKHRDALGRYGWFGRLILPAMVLFQIVFQILGPFVDAQLLFTLASSVVPAILGGSKEIQHSLLSGPFLLALQLYALFFTLEFVSGLIAYRMDRQKPWPLAWLLVQRFAYRQLMYLVMLKSLWRAILGVKQGWGKLKRTGNAA